MFKPPIAFLFLGPVLTILVLLAPSNPGEKLAAFATIAFAWGPIAAVVAAVEIHDYFYGIPVKEQGPPVSPPKKEAA
jgi:hypothetical protein